MDPVERETRDRERAELEAHQREYRRRASLIEHGLLRIARARPDWYAQAACKGNTEIMFDVVDTDRALAICKICPVADPCRALARRDREQGTWGGETETERHELGRGSTVNVTARNKARAKSARRTERARIEREARETAARELAARVPAWKILEARERRSG